jgi:hypothetical protein
VLTEQTRGESANGEVDGSRQALNVDLDVVVDVVIDGDVDLNVVAIVDQCAANGTTTFVPRDARYGHGIFASVALAGGSKDPPLLKIGHVHCRPTSRYASKADECSGLKDPPLRRAAGLRALTAPGLCFALQ